MAVPPQEHSLVLCQPQILKTADQPNGQVGSGKVIVLARPGGFEPLHLHIVAGQLLEFVAKLRRVIGDVFRHGICQWSRPLLDFGRQLVDLLRKHGHRSGNALQNFHNAERVVAHERAVDNHDVSNSEIRVQPIEVATLPAVVGNRMFELWLCHRLRGVILMTKPIITRHHPLRFDRVRWRFFEQP